MKKNKNITKTLKALLFLLVVTPLIFSPGITLAADAPRGGFSLSPGSVEDVVTPGKIKEKTILLKNNTTKQVTFMVEVEDFEASSDPKIDNRLLGENSSDYSLKKYLKPEFDKVSVAGGETFLLKVFIDVPVGVTTPGLYGTVIIRQEVDGTSSDSTKITPRIGILFYITVDGNASREPGLIDLKYIPFKNLCKADNCSNSKNKYDMFEVSFKNTNKVHFSLYGDIEITNIIGKKIGSVRINPWVVMPNSYKTKQIKWENPPTMMGIYEARVRLNDSHSNDIREKSFYFLVIQWQLVVVLVLVSFLIILIFKYKAISKNKNNKDEPLLKVRKKVKKKK